MAEPFNEIDVVRKTFFINESERSVDPADDVGKVVQLEADGKIHRTFLPLRGAKTVYPHPVYPTTGDVSPLTINSNTIAQVGLVTIYHEIIVNTFSFFNASVTVAGTVDISFYTEDGQQLIFSATSATLSVSNQVNTITLASPVKILPGNYYILVNGNSTVNIPLSSYLLQNNDLANNLANQTAGKSIASGTLAITANTPPTTFDPAAITPALSKALIVRFDA